MQEAVPMVVAMAVSTVMRICSTCFQKFPFVTIGRHDYSLLTVFTGSSLTWEPASINVVFFLPMPLPLR